MHSPVELNLAIHNLRVGTHHGVRKLLQGLALVLEVLPVSKLAIVEDLDGLHRL